MRIEIIRTEGLGDSSCVFAHRDVAVVFPKQDIDRFEEALEDTGVQEREQFDPVVFGRRRCNGGIAGAVERAEP